MDTDVSGASHATGRKTPFILLSLAMIAACSESFVSRDATSSNCAPNMSASYVSGGRRVGRVGVDAYSDGVRRTGWYDPETQMVRFMGDGAIASPIVDCSTDAIICVQDTNLQDVYAVPRSDIAVGSSYELLDTRFSVLGCANQLCTTYVVLANRPCDRNCEALADSPADGGERFDRIVYVYAPSRGVVAYSPLKAAQPFDARDMSAFSAERLAKAGWMILEGKIGLLACSQDAAASSG